LSGEPLTDSESGDRGYRWRVSDSSTASEPTFRSGRIGRIALRCVQFLVIAATVWVAGQVLSRLAFVAVPVAIAILVAALFVPGVNLLRARGMPRPLAATVVLLLGIAALGTLVTLVVTSVVDGLPDLGARLNESVNELRDWLTTVGLRPEQLDDMVKEGKEWVSRNRSGLVSGVWGVLSTAGAVLAGLALVLFLLIFFVYDGDRLWRGAVRSLPRRHRERVLDAGRRAFRDLTSYVRTTLIVALIDAVGIGLGLWLTGVPLVLPLAGLVFLGAFVPVIGAFVTGIVAVLVALVTQGLVVALIVVGVVIAVQQLEGNVLEPLLMSHSVRLHPVVVILGLAIGAELAGVVGALLAVPVMLTVRSVAAPFFAEDESPTGGSPPPRPSA
jgi:predicted PurR-regulated permease PerM